MDMMTIIKADAVIKIFLKLKNSFLPGRIDLEKKAGHFSKINPDRIMTNPRTKLAILMYCTILVKEFLYCIPNRI